MRPRAGLGALALAVTALLAAGCGDEERVITETVVRTVTAPPAQPAEGMPDIGRRPAADGEVVIRGEGAPKTYGPFDFEPDEYDFRFGQFAPGREIDFANEASSFSAIVNRRAGRTAPDSQVLANQTSRAGAGPIRLSGRVYVEVQSADFSYVMRFTPRDAP